MCASFGCVPGWQASHETPSAPNSFSPQGSQNADESVNVHWLPGSHGFSAHVATEAAFSQTALLDSSAGLSMVVLVMRTLVAAAIASAAPFGASLVRKALSLMTIAMGPELLIAPPCPELTRNSRLDHMAIPRGQKVGGVSPSGKAPEYW